MPWSRTSVEAPPQSPSAATAALEAELAELRQQLSALTDAMTLLLDATSTLLEYLPAGPATALRKLTDQRRAARAAVRRSAGLPPPPVAEPQADEWHHWPADARV